MVGEDLERWSKEIVDRHDMPWEVRRVEGENTILCIHEADGIEFEVKVWCNYYANEVNFRFQTTFPGFDDPPAGRLGLQSLDSRSYSFEKHGKTTFRQHFLSCVQVGTRKVTDLACSYMGYLEGMYKEDS